MPEKDGFIKTYVKTELKKEALGDLYQPFPTTELKAQIGKEMLGGGTPASSGTYVSPGDAKIMAITFCVMSVLIAIFIIHLFTADPGDSIIPGWDYVQRKHSEYLRAKFDQDAKTFDAEVAATLRQNPEIAVGEQLPIHSNLTMSYAPDDGMTFSETKDSASTPLVPVIQRRDDWMENGVRNICVSFAANDYSPTGRGSSPQYNVLNYHCITMSAPHPPQDGSR